MSLRDGSYHCDRCGADLANGSASLATKVYGRDPDDPYKLRQLDFCIEDREDAPFGCTGNLIGPAALTYYGTEN